MLPWAPLPVNTRASLDTAVVTGDIAGLLKRAQSARGVAAKRHARDVLEEALLSADPGVVTKAERVAARRLGVDASVCDAPEIALPPHSVMVPMVLGLPQGGVGIVRYMRVAFDGSTHNGYDLGLDASAARAVGDALQLAATRLKRSAVDGAYCLTTVHPDAFGTTASQVRVQGPSLGAATFVSAVSLWSERPVRRGTLVTGKLVGDAVRDVGDLDQKLHAAMNGRRDIQCVVVPSHSLARAERALRAGRAKVNVVGVSTLDELIDVTLEETPQALVPIRHRLATLRLEFDQGWQRFGWANVRELAERSLSATSDQNVDLKVDVLSMLGAAEDHLGLPRRSLEILDQALSIARTEQGARWVPDVVLSRVQQRRAMTLRRLCRFAEARKSAAEAIKLAARSKHRDELYKAYGCAGLVDVAAGAAHRALHALECSLDLTHEHAPESCVRSHAYLVEAYAHAGDGARSDRAWLDAVEHAQRGAELARRPMTEAWLRTSRGAALWRLGREEEVIEVLDVPSVRAAIEGAPLPGLLARRYLGMALIHGGNATHGQALLAASDVAYGPSIGTNLAFGAHINVLCEAWALLSREHWDSDIAGRARNALQRFPEHARVGTIERQRQRTLAGLSTAGMPTGTTKNMLRALIDRAARIA